MFEFITLAITALVLIDFAAANPTRSPTTEPTGSPHTWSPTRNPTFVPTDIFTTEQNATNSTTISAVSPSVGPTSDPTTYYTTDSTTEPSTEPTTEPTDGLSADDIEVSASQMTWSAASDWCSNAGLDMVSIHSDTDADAASEACPGYGCWTGLNDQDMDNVWSWSDGKDFDYTNWQIYQPSGDGDCVGLFSLSGSSIDGTWNDKSCDFTEYALCYQGSPTNTTDIWDTTAAAGPTATDIWDTTAAGPSTYYQTTVQNNDTTVDYYQGSGNGEGLAIWVYVVIAVAALCGIPLVICIVVNMKELLSPRKMNVMGNEFSGTSQTPGHMVIETGM